MMRKRWVLLAASVLLASAYVVWPLYAALQIREAMHAGDTATLERKIEWDAVRASLKASLAPEVLARLEADPNAPKPSFWKHIKATVAPAVAETAIDRYVTPEYLPVLFGYRQVWRGSIRPALGLREPKTALAGTWLDGTAIDRFLSFCHRVRRFVFASPGRIVIELEDKYRPERRYVGTMEFRGFDWRLTSLAVVGAGL